MTKKPKYKSELSEAIHSAVAGMYRAGTIDQVTMRNFDERCLTVPKPLQAKQIKKLRKRFHVSQPVFAHHLSVSESTVEKWETGAKKPSGLAQKMLSLIDKHGLELLA